MIMKRMRSLRGKYTLRRVSVKGRTPNRYYTVTVYGYSDFYYKGERKVRRVWNFRTLRRAYDALLFLVAHDNVDFFNDNEMGGLYNRMKGLRYDMEKCTQTYYDIYPNEKKK